MRKALSKKTNESELANRFAKREPIVITKHGRPVAKLVPVNTEVDEILGFFNGRGTITRDLVSPAISPEEGGQSSMRNLR